MTEKEAQPQLEEGDDDLDSKLNYKPPPQKSLKELQEMDKDDESLTKYKKTLLGDVPVVAGARAHGEGARAHGEGRAGPPADSSAVTHSRKPRATRLGGGGTVYSCCLGSWAV